MPSKKREFLYNKDLHQLTAEVAAMGPNVVITGSAVFDGKDAAGNAKFMMETVNNV